MTVLIIGSPDSGKSRIAEDTALALMSKRKAEDGARTSASELIYLATMIPYGKEGKARVEKHRHMRAGKGFTTIEAPYDIDTAMTNCTGCVILLECVSNLTANELFNRKTPAEDTLDKVVSEIGRLSDMAGDLVIVTNHFEDDGSFDEETKLYASLMDMINERLAGVADRVIRI